ncbi:MAG: hypothetical protein AB1563_02070 [Bacillota bacterium]|jgi:hypothetical protein
MRDGIVGIGIDLTQHVPFVSVAMCPDAVRIDGSVDSMTVVHYWPPKVELRQSFRSQLPSVVLPLMPGEPLLVGDLAAKHRRSMGLAWPPEAQVPYAGDPTCGVGRIPLVAAWTALLSSPGIDEGLARRDDPEFKWCPEGREHSARAGQILAASVKAFLNAACVPLNSSITAIVIPDALDEAGQQILLDSLAQVGLATEKVHLLSRPLAVALHWCHTTDTFPIGKVKEDEEGTAVGRLRIMTMGLDVWEAVSLELRARRHGNRAWIVPVRDRAQLADVTPELPTLGFSFALALACAKANGEPLGWWSHMCAGDWLARRLSTDQALSSQELQALRQVCSSRLPESLRQELSQITTLQPLWSRLLQSSSPLRDAIHQRWESQERVLSIDMLPCTEVLVDGAFTWLLSNPNPAIEKLALPAVPESILRISPLGQPAAVLGAALAAAAIAGNLPCYREKLLPLDLYVLGKDEYGDPAPQWKELVAAESVEAGRVWHSPPITGLQISKNQDKLLLPLRRLVHRSPIFRKVSTELVAPATQDEPVRVEVEVKPGQGFARVRIESVTPGVCATRLDWRTMEECDEPKPPPLTYLPRVSRIQPDREMFERAWLALEAALRALKQNNPAARERLRDAIVNHLNKWPLAHNVELARGHTIPKDFMRHYGVIGSDGNLDELPKPDLARDLRDAIGEKFGELVQRQSARSALGKILLRAGGWFYLSVPKECFAYLRSRLAAASRNFLPLSPEELHAIGLTFEAPDDLRRFYPLVVRALRDPSIGPNNWLRAVRNICRFRNHALHPGSISDSDLYQLAKQLFATLREQTEHRNFGQIFRNCLETIPFLLKRRPYDSEFLAPTSQLAQELIHFLEKVDRENRQQLPHRLQSVPRATVNFLQMEATTSDIEALLGVEEEGDGDD